MTGKERFLAVLKGENPDRIPWTPRLDIWFDYHTCRGSLPEKYKNKTLEEIRIDIGADMSARNGKVYEEIYKNCEITYEKKDNVLSKTITTPKGVLVERYRDDPNEMQSVKIEHFIKSDKDYELMECFYSNLKYEERDEDYLAYEKEVGKRALPLCNNVDVPIALILRELIGYNRAYYELADNRSRIDSLHEVICRNHDQLQEVISGSPGKLFLHGKHFDSQMTPPPLFEEYVLPYLQGFCDEMERQKKWVAIHQDADASRLLELIKKAGVHVADCFCSYPMVPVTIEKAFEVWGDDIVIWGGIPSTILCPSLYDEKMFKKMVHNIMEKISGRRVILAVADNVMPEADIERVRYISRLIRRQ